MSLICTKDLSFSYNNKPVLQGINLEIEQGSFVSIIGSNGSGKSTFARLLVGLLQPTGGEILVNGLTTADPRNLSSIRKAISLVFQNPENQIVGDTVEDDIAFGLENLGLAPEEMERRISHALEVCGITDLRSRTCSKLSGGQKQREAIAAAVAMGSKCIILDEATSMLDPKGRTQVLDLIHKLNKENGTTVLFITNRMDECAASSRVVVFGDFQVVLDGSPRQVFSQRDQLARLGLDVPLITRLGFALAPNLEAVTSAEELAKRIALEAKGGSRC